jgi:hypothetical protein
LTQINARFRVNAYAPGMPSVLVSPFTPADIAEAIVLAGLGGLDITAEQWGLFTSDDADDRGLVARDGRGRLSGLVLFAISKSEERHSCLRVEHLICFDLFEPATIADALIAEMLQLAEGEGCDRLSLVRSMPDLKAAAALVRASEATALLRIF